MKKNYMKYGLFCVVVVGICIMLFVIFSNVIQYENRTIENKSSDFIQNISMEKEVLVSQAFEIVEKGPVVLKSIQTIFVNLPAESKEGKLNVGIWDEKGKNLIQEQYDISSFLVGEYQQLKFNKKVALNPKQTYTIVFSAESEKCIPYLLIQDKNNQNVWNGILKIDEQIQEGSLLICYECENLLPMPIKITIATILLLILCGCYQLFFGVNPKLEKYILLAICLISLIPLLILAKYNRQVADDYDFARFTHEAVLVEESNILAILGAASKTVIHFFFNWQGLYSATFLNSLQPGIWGEKYYSLTTVLLLILFTTATYFFMRIIRRIFCETKDNTLFWTALLMTALMQGLPSVREGLYWYCGAMAYMPFFFWALLNFALTIGYVTQEGIKSRKYIIGSCILAFWVAGGNYVASFMNILLLLFYFVICIPKKKYAVVLPLAVGIIGFAITLLAPGTANRQAAVDTQEVITTMLASIVEYCRLLKQWINLQWVAFMFIMTPFAMEVLQVEKRKKNRKYYPVLFIGSATVILLGMLCAPYYAMGNFGGGRLINVVWMAFMVFSVAGYTYVLCWAQWYMEQKSIRYKKLPIAKLQQMSIFVVLILCLFGNDGTMRKAGSVEALKEIYLTYEAVDYAQEMDQRIEQIREAQDRGDESIEVSELSRTSRLLSDGSDITDDISYWKNKSMSKYYGINITLKK